MKTQRIIYFVGFQGSIASAAAVENNIASYIFTAIALIYLIMFSCTVFKNENKN